ncbi:MAG: DNA starvation/stationary phase protection protein, partial [Halobacteriovoraceae bacterium]|nr:DNA starvation/stationary phase protection protein [Halobacteriovoraceae bacterium]
PVGNISNEEIKNTASFLNTLLANEYALFTKTLNYHWNVEGPRFHSLHTFLETQYNSLLTKMDSIAERVRVLGESPLSTVKEMASQMNINEVNGKDLSSSEMLEDLYLTHMTIHEDMRMFLKEMNNEEDPGTEDFIVSLINDHEMMAWKLKSHIV